MKSIIIPPETRWVATTFDEKEFIFSEAEYELYKKATMADIKVLHFKTVSFALSDIRRIEKEVIPEKQTFEFEKEDDYAS